MLNHADPSEFLLELNSRKKTIPIELISNVDFEEKLSSCSPTQKNWIVATDWKPKLGGCLLVPDEKGALNSVLFGIGSESADRLSPLIFGSCPAKLPAGNYHIESQLAQSDMAVLAWLLGSYRYTDYKTIKNRSRCRLKPSKSNSIETVNTIARNVYLGRNLINKPANDCGPQELESCIKDLAKRSGARVKTIMGEALLKNNFPMIHAVGRASDRAPRLIDLTWGTSGPKITLVGKGICFDTGGLNIKPGASMLLMKKDMGGAAASIALAGMIIEANLKVRLRLLVPAADNNISENAFRPGDILESRNGMTVEIKNTDAEGRLVLADALALADEQSPDYLISFATLTGAARVALGPDLPPIYADDDDFAEKVSRHGLDVGDNVWRMPFWQPYEQLLESQISDVQHLSEGPFAGSVTAALFLKKFVTNAAKFAHFDIYAWVPRAKPGQPVGGEVQASRALFEYFRSTF